jgi:single-strand DNA-binding protein
VQDSSITVVGNVVADPVLRRLDDGTEVASFRVASTPRVRDRESGRWVDGATSWWGVTCWRGLAGNVAASLRRGERVVVVGRPRTRQWEKEGRSGTSVDVTADVVGHDLAWGTSSFSRVVRAERVEVPGRAEADELARECEEASDRERLAAALGAEVDDDGVLADAGAPRG